MMEPLQQDRQEPSASTTRRQQGSSARSVDTFDTKYRGDEKDYRLANEIYASYLQPRGWVHKPSDTDNWLYVPGSLLGNRPKKKRVSTWLKESGVSGVHYAAGDAALCELLRDYGIHHAPKDLSDYPIPRTGPERYTLDQLINEYRVEIGEAVAPPAPAPAPAWQQTSARSFTITSEVSTEDPSRGATAAVMMAATAPPAQQELSSRSFSFGTTNVSTQEPFRRATVAASPPQESPTTKSNTDQISFIKDCVKKYYGDESISLLRLWGLGDVFKRSGDDMLHGGLSTATRDKRKIYHASSLASDGEGKKRSKSSASVHRSRTDQRCISPSTGMDQPGVPPTGQFDQLKSQLEAKDVELKDMSKRLEELEVEKKLGKVDNAQLKSQLEENEAHIKLLEVQRDNLEEEKDYFEEQVFRLGLEVEGSKTEVETAAKQVKALETQVEALDWELVVKFDKKNDDINKLRGKIERLKEKDKKDSEEKKTKIVQLVDELRHLKVAHKKKDKERRSVMKHLEDEVEALKRGKHALETEKRQMKSEMERLRRRSSPPSDDEDILRGLDKDLIEQINNQIVDNGEEVTLDQIAGLENAKKTVHQLVTYPMKCPDLFTGSRACPKGLLLFGPPGTGKTTIAKAIAHESGATFFSLSSSDLTSKWLGEGEKLIKTLFAVAAYKTPSIVFIDEVDSMLTNRRAEEDDAIRRMKTEFLVQLDGAGNRREGYVLVMGATNRPQDLDKGALRRFAKRLYLPLPNQPARETLLRTLVAKNSHSLTDDDFKNLSRDTEGYSGSDLKDLCNDASFRPVMTLSLEVAMRTSPEDVPPISYEHFCQSLRITSPSVGQEDLQAYVDWSNAHGTKPDFLGN